MTDPAAAPPPSYLMEFILGLLAPLLMAGGITDNHLARAAATEVIGAYRANGQSELVTVGQILAFALTALDNLRLSMAPDLSLSMKLKLRGNANALSRCAGDNARLLDHAPRASDKPERSIAEQAATAGRDRETRPETATEFAADTQPAPQETAAASPIQPATAAEHRNRLHWASAMQREAARLQADGSNIPLAEQKTNTLWIDVLTGVARDLTQGRYKVAAPGTSKSDLLRTTLMTSGSGFPAHLLKAAGAEPAAT
jgi:hypothetical protein